jgi:hypothetical protein
VQVFVEVQEKVEQLFEGIHVDGWWRGRGEVASPPVRRRIDPKRSRDPPLAVDQV